MTHHLLQVEWRKLPADASAIFLPDFCRSIAPESFLSMRTYKVEYNNRFDRIEMTPPMSLLIIPNL